MFAVKVLSRHYRISSLNFIQCNSLKNFYSTDSENNENHYDIIVAGGGMVGTTLACTLGKNSLLSNKRILLLEASSEKPWKLPELYSNRVSSVNIGTRKLLDEIDVWKHIAAARFAVVKKLQVWDALSEAMITFNTENMVDDIAYVVENDLIINAAYLETKGLSNVTIINEARITDYDLPNLEKNITKVKLSNGSTYSCTLLLGCDGFNSQVRKAMKITYVSWNYEQRGIVATLKLSEPIDNVVAWQRFLPTGPIAILPLTDKLSSLVWSTTPKQAEELLALTEDEFIDKVNDALWKQYSSNTLVETATKGFDMIMKTLNFSSTSEKQLPPTIEACEEKSIAAFPLGFGHSTNYISKGVALVGDAAHRVHPLAGQGVNLGFGDVTCLNNILGEAVYAGCDLADLSYLKKYETERQMHNVPTMLAVEALFRLYNTDSAPFVFLRSIGLQATHALNPLKKAIISHAAI